MQRIEITCFPDRHFWHGGYDKAGLADVERDLIRTRTAEGRSRAKGRGQHMGRPPALTPQQQAEARQRRQDGATLKELAESYNVGIATIARLGAA